MSPFIPALIGGAISAYGQYRANRETRASTQRQMDFQQRMSNTAHQRQMADLKTAGINPMLSAKLGGASSPAGASYQAGNIGASAVEGYGKVSSAKQAQAQAKYISGAQTEQTQSQTNLNQAQQNKVEQEVKQLIPAQAWNLTSQAKAANSAALLSDARSALVELESSLTELDVRAFKLITKELGLPVGPQTAKSTIEAWKAASKNLDQLGALAEWGMSKIPMGKGWKAIYNMVKKLRGR